MPILGIMGAAVAGAIAAGACADRAPESAGSGAWSGSVDTAADGGVVVRNGGGGAWRRDTVLAERAVLLGEAGITEGGEENTFGDVTGLAVDARGRIYVADRQASTVRAFSPEGRHLGLLAGEGGGPGEIGSPYELAVGPDGLLAVADVRGLTFLRPPAEGAPPTEPAGSWTLSGGYPQPYRPMRVDCGGTVHYPANRPRPGSAQDEHFYLRVDPGEGARDTVRVPALRGLPGGTPFVRTGPGGGRMVAGVDRPPLSPVASWDVTPAGELLVGEARAYELALLGPAGDTVRSVRRSLERRPIPEAVRRESVAALRTRLDTLPVPASRVENLPEEVAELRLPERYPAYREVHAASDGRLWVERPPLEGRADATPYDVFDAAGVYLGTVVLPVRFAAGRGFVNARSLARPQFTADRAYGVVVDPVTGVQRVAGFRFEPPAREEGAPPAPPPPCGETTP